MKHLISYTLLFFFLVSCNNKPNEITIDAGEPVQIDPSSGSCPYLTKDNKGSLVISWIKQDRDSVHSFCYAVSKDEGKRFGKVIEIPGSSNVKPHGENMPKIIFKPSGEIIAAWGASNPNPKNKYAGLVYYSQSFDEGKTWTLPQNLTKDTGSFDQRYFDLALLPNGEAAAVWLDNRKQWDKEGSGLYYAVTNENEGFGQEKLISGPCCQCCRTDLMIDRNKNIHVLYRAIINDSIRDMVHIVSKDNGKSFSKPQRISEDNWVLNGCPHTGPAMAENEKGIHFTWFTGGATPGIYYNHSADNGLTFSQRENCSGKAAMHCQINSMPGNNILIAWNEDFVNAGKLSSRIGIEVRDADGKSISKTFVTSEEGKATYPVCYPINSTKALLSYTEKIKDLDYIFFKQVAIQ